MDLAQIISDLRSQGTKLNEAILSLERLVKSRPKGRGRPRKVYFESQPAEVVGREISFLGPHGSSFSTASISLDQISRVLRDTRGRGDSSHDHAVDLASYARATGHNGDIVQARRSNNPILLAAQMDREHME